MKRVIYVLSEEINLDEWWGIYRWKGEVFYKKNSPNGHFDCWRCFLQILLAKNPTIASL